MAVDLAERDTRRALDATALERTLRRLESGPAPWLHTEVARRMAERLAVVRRTPETVLDWWPDIGAGLPHLRSAYPQARILSVQRTAVGASSSPVKVAGPVPRPSRWPGLRWPWRRASGSAEPPSLREDAVPAQVGQLLWANMVLHGAQDPAAVLQRWRQALAADGFVMFSTLGPGTLASLRRIYAVQGWGEPHAAFVDMHDLGDMMVRAGFADPVMDQETLTLTWSDPKALLAELQGLGANLAPGRMPGLRTPRWRARLLQALATTAGVEGRVALEFEVVYGHAFCPSATASVAAETHVGLEQMRAMLRSQRGRG